MSEDLEMFELTNELNTQSPASCTGNGCANVSLRAVFHPGTLTIHFMSVQNNGQKSIRFRVNWGGVFAPRGSQWSEEIISGGQSIDLYTPVQYITGYWSCTAVHQ